MTRPLPIQPIIQRLLSLRDRKRWRYYTDEFKRRWLRADNHYPKLRIENAELHIEHESAHGIQVVSIPLWLIDELRITQP